LQKERQAGPAMQMRGHGASLTGVPDSEVGVRPASGQKRIRRLLRGLTAQLLVAPLSW